MLSFKITKRHEPLLWGSFFILFGALALSLAFSAIMLALQHKPPARALALLFTGAFGSWWSIQSCLIKAVPIFLCSLGVAIAFRLQIWNIGAEGQYAMGAIGATWVALHFPDLSGSAVLPCMLMAALIAGGLWDFVPAVLKIRMRANEIIVTLMLNYLAILFLDYLVYGPWKDPVSFGFPMTREFSASAIVGKIGHTQLNWGIVICIFSGVAIWIFLRYTRLGYEIKAAGENIKAAKYAGLPYDRQVILVMFLSGALAGWAGFLEASATINRLQPSIMVGYGYTAIVVAWLARLNPINISIASFLLAGLRVGLENLQLDLQVPSAFSGIMEGMILLTVLAGSFFIDYHITLRKAS